MLDNIEIAILTKVNELADRQGIKPYEFCAVIHTNDDPSKLTLQFEVPVSNKSATAKNFSHMLDSIGFGQESHSLTGSDQQIIDALDVALRLAAPRQRPRS